MLPANSGVPKFEKYGGRPSAPPPSSLRHLPPLRIKCTGPRSTVALSTPNLLFLLLAPILHKGCHRRARRLQPIPLCPWTAPARYLGRELLRLEHIQFAPHKRARRGRPCGRGLGSQLSHAGFFRVCGDACRDGTVRRRLHRQGPSRQFFTFFFLFTFVLLYLFLSVLERHLSMNPA